MQKSFVVLWTLFSLISCYSGQSDTKMHAADNEVEELKTEVSTPPAQTCTSQIGKLLEELKNYLSVDYNVEYSEIPEDLEFVEYDMDMTEKYSLHLGLSSYHLFRIKSKEALPGSDSKYYPAFNLRVFCIQASERDMINTEQSINNILSSRDPVNDKLYDYLLRSGNTFLYSSTVTKMFQSHMERRMDDLRHIIDDNKLKET